MTTHLSGKTEQHSCPVKSIQTRHKRCCSSMASHPVTVKSTHMLLRNEPREAGLNSFIVITITHNKRCLRIYITITVQTKESPRQTTNIRKIIAVSTTIMMSIPMRNRTRLVEYCRQNDSDMSISSKTGSFMEMP